MRKPKHLNEWREQPRTVQIRNWRYKYLRGAYNHWEINLTLSFENRDLYVVYYSQPGETIWFRASSPMLAQKLAICFMRSIRGYGIGDYKITYRMSRELEVAVKIETLYAKKNN